MGNHNLALEKVYVGYRRKLFAESSGSSSRSRHRCVPSYCTTENPRVEFILSRPANRVCYPLHTSCRCLKIQEKRKQAFEDVWSRTEKVIAELWPDSVILPYGSWASSMMLPGSDVDLVVRFLLTRFLHLGFEVTNSPSFAPKG